ncbi:hypothetical protein PFLUV_G00202560 [Perca fluviatilis]|uniref:Uncharacterized protein n=1 Tax=Perca fluviatilis TaxID=8168 RepID=A0A6A5EA32_PERFL|nr:hypothetical protein PFLUV_G00202560 [Perca fluviatilis]
MVLLCPAAVCLSTLENSAPQHSALQRLNRVLPASPYAKSPSLRCQDTRGVIETAGQKGSLRLIGFHWIGRGKCHSIHSPSVHGYKQHGHRAFQLV